MYYTIDDTSSLLHDMIAAKLSKICVSIDHYNNIADRVGHAMPDMQNAIRKEINKVTAFIGTLDTDELCALDDWTIENDLSVIDEWSALNPE